MSNIVLSRRRALCDFDIEWDTGFQIFFLVCYHWFCLAGHADVKLFHFVINTCRCMSHSKFLAFLEYGKFVKINSNN